MYIKKNITLKQAKMMADMQELYPTDTKYDCVEYNIPIKRSKNLYGYYGLYICFKLYNKGNPITNDDWYNDGEALADASIRYAHNIFMNNCIENNISINKYLAMVSNYILFIDNHVEVLINLPHGLYPEIVDGIGAIDVCQSFVCDAKICDIESSGSNYKFVEIEITDSNVPLTYTAFKVKDLMVDDNSPVQMAINHINESGCLVVDTPTFTIYNDTEMVVRLNTLPIMKEFYEG